MILMLLPSGLTYLSQALAKHRYIFIRILATSLLVSIS